MGQWKGEKSVLLTFFSQFIDDEVVTAIEKWVNGKDPDFFSSKLMALEHRWSKCITLEGHYIEKEETAHNRK